MYRPRLGSLCSLRSETCIHMLLTYLEINVSKVDQVSLADLSEPRVRMGGAFESSESNSQHT